MMKEQQLIDIIATVCLKTLEILKIKESVQEVYKYTLYAVELNLDPCITETEYSRDRLSIDRLSIAETGSV